jgi:hypothetical protein
MTRPATVDFQALEACLIVVTTEIWFGGAIRDRVDD